VLKAVQDQCHYWAGRGDCLQALGQYENAYHDYSAAVRISPSRSVPASFPHMDNAPIYKQIIKLDTAITVREFLLNVMMAPLSIQSLTLLQ
jgi:tetratricopeptide (TPR) repeat protein